MESDEAGLCLINDPRRRSLYMFNHIEYDTTSLARRILARPRRPESPSSFRPTTSPKNDPEQPPENRWRSHAHLLFGNWINEVYQTTPFDLAKIGG